MALFDKINCNSANMCLKIKTQVPLESTFGPKKVPKKHSIKNFMEIYHDAKSRLLKN